MELYDTKAHWQKHESAAAVAALEPKLLPDVVRRKYELGRRRGCFFKVIVRTEVFREGRIGAVSSHVTDVIDRELEPREGFRAYARYRSVAEQEQLQEASWVE